MITVRFPSGFSVQYNDANFIERKPTWPFVRILTQKGGEIIAHAPSEALIELAAPCLVYDAVVDTLSTKVAALEKEVRGLRRDLKRKGGK